MPKSGPKSKPKTFCKLCHMLVVDEYYERHLYGTPARGGVPCRRPQTRADDGAQSGRSHQEQCPRHEDPG